MVSASVPTFEVVYSPLVPEFWKSYINDVVGWATLEELLKRRTLMEWLRYNPDYICPRAIRLEIESKPFLKAFLSYRSADGVYLLYIECAWEYHWEIAAMSC